MTRAMQVSDSIVIPGVSPAEVFALVSDPTQMPRWSRENVEVTAERGASGSLVVGDTFIGVNRRGGSSWRTRSVVRAAEPGERFMFDVVAWGQVLPRVRTPLIPIAIARWEYAFEPVEGGTLVTETWRDSRRKWPDALTLRLDRLLTGGRTYAEHQKDNIARTLAALRDDLGGPDVTPDAD